MSQVDLLFQIVDFFTEIISAFLEYHLKPLSQKVKWFIKDTNDFLKKLNKLWDLPDDFIICTIWCSRIIAKYSAQGGAGGYTEGTW